jgi:hypothetical protein
MRRILRGAIVALVAIAAGCDHDDLFHVPDCLVSIGVPTDEATFETSQAAIIVGGAAAGVSYIRIFNSETGYDDWTGVIYGAPGAGSWAFHSGVALAEGTNHLNVTAHRNGIDETACSRTSLVVTRTPAR